MSGADRYGVIGNPVAHSLSPEIHRLFAQACDQSIDYRRYPAPLDGFVACVDAFREAGGRGLNVTVPFKIEAARYASRLGQRALAAGAVNTLRFDGAQVLGENTDGLGLVADLQGRLGFALAGARVVVFGAGGATRGVIGPLLDAGVEQIRIVNRSRERAQALLDALREPLGRAPISLADYDALEAEGVNLAINATSAGLSGAMLPIPSAFWRPGPLAYEMVYGASASPFMCQAREAGCERVSDGLGMLIEQAAESFAIWRGIRPATAAVFAQLRALVDQRR